MKRLLRGEVWLVDLGYLGKVRPCLIIASASEDDERALVSFVPRTTQLRNSKYEVDIELSFLKTGAFDAQQIGTTSRSKFMRRLGKLTDDQMSLVMDALRNWLEGP
jgi:mRNA interferase MazF